MKKWIIAIIILHLFVILYVIWGRSNEQDLGDNYYYLPLHEAVDIGYPYGAIIYKSAERNVFSDVKVHKNVINVNKNKDFIIVIQQDSGVNNNSSLPKAQDDKHLHYYIIAKQTDMVYGPFSQNEYLKKRDELKIPNNLEFDSKEQCTK